MLAQTDRLVSRTPFYYGWIILFVGGIGLVLTSPGQTYAVSIFIEHFIADFGISRSLVSTLYTVGTLAASFILPTIGRLIDRRGSRQMMTLIAGLLALACLYMSLVQNAVMLLLGFLALRLFGQGSLSLVSSNVINQWWVRRRGMAMGLSGIGISLLGVGGFPNLIQWLIGLVGWRTSYALLGLLVAAVLIPLALFFLRDTPESLGLEPDGFLPPAPTDPGAPLTTAIVEENWTRAEAIRTIPFWVLSLGGMSIAMLSTGLYFHLVSIFADNGFAPEIAAAIFLPASLGTAVFNLGGGFLSDRVAARWLLAVALLMQAAALLLAPALRNIGLAVVFGVLLGGLSGLSNAVNVVVWANYFGRRHLGSIAGLATTILVFGAALGPMPIGIARDVLGSYNTVLRLFALLPLALALAALTWGKQPQRT